jgi:hypothetical protein
MADKEPKKGAPPQDPPRAIIGSTEPRGTVDLPKAPLPDATDPKVVAKLLSVAPSTEPSTPAASIKPTSEEQGKD